MCDYELHNEVLATAFPRFAHLPLAGKAKLGVAPRRFLRRLNADLWRFLARSRASLVDRAPLMRRTLAGALRGDPWPVQGRRAALIVYLVELERLATTPGRLKAVV